MATLNRTQTFLFNLLPLNFARWGYSYLCSFTGKGRGLNIQREIFFIKCFSTNGIQLNLHMIGNRLFETDLCSQWRQGFNVWRWLVRTQYMISFQIKLIDFFSNKDSRGFFLYFRCYFGLWYFNALNITITNDKFMNEQHCHGIVNAFFMCYHTVYYIAIFSKVNQIKTKPQV